MIQRHPLAFALGLALLVALPTLSFGFWVDDYYHLAILEYGEEVGLEIAGPFDLFYFAPGDPEIMREALNERPLPWFTLPELHLHFFRPLTSALFTLDHALWGLWALPYHVHSVFWYLVLVCAVWWVYRRVLPWGVAMLATVLFTIDDVHTIPVAWIANRNGLLAVTFVFLGFAAHLAWRREGKWWGLPLSVAGYVLGLCAGEAALGAMVYVGAFELAGLGSRVSGLEQERVAVKSGRRWFGRWWRLWLFGRPGSHARTGGVEVTGAALHPPPPKTPAPPSKGERSGDAQPEGAPEPPAPASASGEQSGNAECGVRDAEWRRSSAGAFDWVELDSAALHPPPGEAPGTPFKGGKGRDATSDFGNPDSAERLAHSIDVPEGDGSSFPPSKGVPESSRAGDVAQPGEARNNKYSLGDTIFGILPVLITTAAYLIFYRLSGYGVSGSGMYLDPIGEPLHYLRLAPERILSLVGAQVLAFPAEISLAAPVLGLVTAGAGVIGLGVLVWLLRLVWAEMAAVSKRTVCWLIAGGLLGLIPVAATFPSSRLLMAPSFGFAGAVALVLWHGWKLRQGWRWPARAALVLLALVNCVAAPAAWWVQTAGLNVIARFHDSLFQTAEIVDDPDARLVFLRAPEPFSAFYTTAVRALYGHPMPKSTWALSLSPEPQVLRRVDERTLELRLLEGRMLDSPIEQLFRTPRIGYAPGDVVELDGLTVTILATEEGFPTEVRFEFDEPLEAGPYQFLQFEDGRLVQATPPGIEEERVLPRAPGVFGIELRHLLAG